MKHTIETLAALFIGDRNECRTTDKQGKWLSDLLDQAGCRTGIVYLRNGLSIELVALRGRQTDYRITRGVSQEAT